MDWKPEQVTQALRTIGASIRIARVRRRMSAKDFASRIEVSLPTLRKLERGDAGVSTGVLATSLWVLGLIDSLQDAVRPERDAVGASLEIARLPKRVRQAKDNGLEGL